MTHLFFISSLGQAWKPNHGFVYFLIVLGAFLFAGVALSIFTFYEDYYWGDEAYRRYLKDGKKRSAKV